MRVTLNIPQNEVSAFQLQLNAVLTKVGNGSRKALKEACDTILDASLEQVPRDTGTLASTGYYEITGDYRTGWQAEIGYGGAMDRVNPRSKALASQYMLKVHEDLSAMHPNGGKAKFLEDPVRDYTAKNFPRTVYKYFKESLEY